jgi:1-acyl-sn-glycerol-3-phosphate acyltransferase
LTERTSRIKRAAQEAVRVSWSALLRTFFGPEVENSPDWSRLGGVIFAPNHASFLDPIAFQAAVPHPIRFMMTEGIYRIRAFRWLFDLWDTIPVPDGEAVKVAAIKEALKVVRGGKPLVIFPEGGISRNGRLQPGQPGVVALMARARVPVIPVAILGTWDVLPYHATFPRAHRIKVRFGEPMLPPDSDLDRDGQRVFAERIMNAIHLLGAPKSRAPQ